ncbi:hypothetical protein CTI12_AA387250 [Artemisia annua]|uniref:CCHC-type domain-containing protein n=1 Tax=Artemisia annua TaxID=35608 RepID=A0A2U1MGI7_ARTAN|nr:hypothetical protein CTI12_AA387250 [Artemisia annua]
MLNKTLSRFRVHIFLAGLDPDFNQARSEILRKDPPLDLESCYAYIRKDQNQRQTMEEPKLEPDSMVHMATRSRPPKAKNQNGKTFTCTHCGEEGHSKLRCYEIIGYPDWWDFTKKPRKKIGQASIATSSQTEAVNTPMAAHTSANSELGSCDINNEEISGVDTNIETPEVAQDSTPPSGLSDFESTGPSHSHHGVNQDSNSPDLESGSEFVVQETDGEGEEVDEHNEPRYPVRMNRGVPKKQYQADLKVTSRKTNL